MKLSKDGVIRGVICILVYHLITWIAFGIIYYPESAWNVLVPWSGWGKTLGYTITFFIILFAGLIPTAFDGAICLMRKWMKGREF